MAPSELSCAAEGVVDVARLGRRSVFGLAGVVALGVLVGCGRRTTRTTSGAARAAAPAVASAPTKTSHAYGPAKAQVADLLRPAGVPHGVVVLVHGGYWQAGYDRSLEDRVAADLVSRGWAVWNLDYRAVGDGGGWPNTFTDVAAGADLLVEVAGNEGLALDRVVTVGHSAGGTLALWLAARHRLPAGGIGASPKLRPTAAVTQAGVNDLAAGSRDGLGGGAVDSVMGGSPTQVPDHYRVADPAALVPIGVRQLVVTGADDTVVPPDQSTAYAARTNAAGDTVDLVVVPHEDHFAHLDPKSGAWKAAVDWLDGLTRTG